MNCREVEEEHIGEWGSALAMWVAQRYTAKLKWMRERFNK